MVKVKPLHRGSVDWAKTHAEFREGKFFCRVTGHELSVVHMAVHVWEDPSVDNKTPFETLQSGRHIEPTYIDRLYCHACEEGAPVQFRVLHSDLLWELEEI